ncbi:MAG: hypothetical protein QW220_06780, partial [Candidatus Bathyarchaeia archaeon]
AYLRLSLRLSYHSFASLGWLPPHAAVIHPSWKDSRAAAQVKDGLVWFGKAHSLYRPLRVITLDYIAARHQALPTHRSLAKEA